MAKQPQAGRVAAPGQLLREIRESIPKTIDEVAEASGVSARTVSSAEKSKKITYDTLERLSVGLNVPYQRLYCAVRGIEYNEQETLKHKPRFRVTLTIEGDFEDEALHRQKDFLEKIAVAIQAMYPMQYPRSVQGSVLLSVSLQQDDAKRLFEAFFNRRLIPLGVTAVQILSARRSNMAEIKDRYAISGYEDTFEDVQRTISQQPRSKSPGKKRARKNK